MAREWLKQEMVQREPKWLWSTLVSIIGLIMAVGLVWCQPAVTAEPAVISTEPQMPLSQSAYLYRLDPETGAFFTVTLPEGSELAAVSVVSDTASQQAWFSEPDLGRIGRLVYTSSLDYRLDEFNVGANPLNLVASETDVWFTLPAQNQVGRLEVATGVVTVYDLPSPQADPADIALDPNGQVWIAERAVDRLALVTVSPTVTITEHVLPGSGQRPEGVLPVEDGSVWFAGGGDGYVWRLIPESGSYLVAVPMGQDSYPYRLASDESNRIWVTLKDTNQLAMIVPGTLLYTVFYTIPTVNSQPTAIGVDPLGRIYFAEQSASQIGRFDPTAQEAATLVEYSLPQSNLKLADLAVAEDGSIWAVAYPVIHRVHMPILMQNYDSGFSPFAVQMYTIGGSSGLTQAVVAGVRSVRFPVRWSQIEPVNTTPDHYNWADLDNSIQMASQQGIQFILTIDSNPSWAAARSRGPVTNTADLQEFIGAVVARYPQIQRMEFYNEPDDRKAFGLNGAGYAAMLQSIYPVVKAANPNAQVVMGGLALDWFIENGGPFDSHFLDDILANCTGRCFDVANFHYYPWFRYVWEPYGRDIIGKATFVRQKLTSRGYNRPVINTEVGWPSSTTWGSPELQARYVSKTYVRALAAGLPLANWYAWLDADTSNPGLLEPDLKPRPAYTAYQTLVTLMRSAHFGRAIPPAETGASQIEGYQFSFPNLGGQRRLDVYWYDCPSLYVFEVGGMPTDCDSVAPLRISAPQVAVIDKMGARTVLYDIDDGVADGKVTIPGGVGASPIYVDYAP